MNEDDAKVPKVDGDWQSIEIFLFSNGQQYSPPRKYFLGADDLNLWDATLKQLGQSHYGLQNAIIDLYTTDGQLVEGPLELRDGQAYVAVASPDTFIDAGYQKYLLKASRSWERRQARRKVITECVPDELCCLCPEKEWCCDLQTCCLCAEKEDAHIPEPLLPTTGYSCACACPCPADEHFMSSAPTKPDNYITSSKIRGATAGEHEVTPYKCGYSSVLVQARPYENEVRPGEHAARSVKYGARLSENALIPGKNEPRLSKNEAKLREYELNSGKNGALSSDDETKEAGSQRYIIKKDVNEIELLENEKSLNNSNDKPDKDTGDADSDCDYTCKFRKGSSILSHIVESELEKKSENVVKDCGSGVNGDEQSGRENDTGIGVVAPRPRKIESARRLSEIENEGRPGEPTREFPLSRVSEQKCEETNPVGRAASQVVGENETKLSEQRKKQGDHVARLSGQVSREDNHEAGSVNSSSEPGAKPATSGSRASPRDRFSSTAKNLGQHKLEIPSTIIDEDAPRLNESKDRGTARKSSLSMGRSSIEKKRFSSGQNSSLLRKPTATSSVLRKSEDKKPIKPNKEILPKKMSGSSSITAPASSEKSKPSKFPYKRITPPALPPPTISFTKILTKQESLATDKAPLENVIDEKQSTNILSTYSFRNPESEVKSFILNSVKQVDTISNFSKETQTEVNVENNKPSSDNKEVQTVTEAIEQHGKGVCSCKQAKDYKIATVDKDDENIISILNKGDIINLKLNIEVRNIVRSVHSSLKNSPKSRSLTEITRSEKESQISIDDEIFVQNNTLQSAVNDQHFQGYGFEGSPKVMIVQCAGCGTLNPALRAPPPCCNNDKNYLVMLANSVHEDNTNNSSNFNPVNSVQSQPSDQKQSQSRKPTNPFSEITLDTITTVTISGGPIVKREMGNCVTTNTSCRNEEPQNECVMTKRKVSITDDSGTKCSFQEQSVSSLSVTKYTDNLSSCLKTCKYEEIEVCSELCPPVCPTTCPKIQSACSKASEQICPQVQSKGCQPICPQVQTQGCSPNFPPFCAKSPPTPVCPHGCPPPPPCFSKPPTPVCPQGCPPLPLCCSKPPPILVCPQGCPPPPPPPCCPKPPPACPPYCPKLPPTPVCPQGCPPPPSCPKPSPTTASSQCCPISLPSIQIQTQISSQEPQLTDAQTQTRWARIALQARLHCDGRYSFHLPPLSLLNNYPI